MTQEAMRRLQLLGPVYVEHISKAQKNESAEDERHAVPHFRSRRTVALLGYLVAEQRPIGREHLALLFWPDEPPSRGRGNLRRELHNLAQILPDCWELDRQTVSFVPSDNTVVDLYQLLQLEEQERWREAAELLGAEFLEGIFLDNNPEYENWLLGERENWRARTERILRRVIEGHKRRGQFTEAIHCAQRLLQLSPWDEETHAQLMRFLAWTGQRGVALRQFESCKRALKEELNVEPALETIALYQKIQDGKLSLPPQLPAFLTEEKPRHKFERPPFVGREEELAQLDTFFDEAIAGQNRVIFISGGPGRGKTALLNAFTQRAMERNTKLLVANGNCNAYSGVGDPYLPYREVIAMLTGDVEGKWDAGAITRDHALRLWEAHSFIIQTLLDYGPHLLDVLIPSDDLLSRSTSTEPEDSPWIPQLRKLIARNQTRDGEVEQSYLFQQVTQVLLSVARTQPLLLILDDIQWADTASISLLFHLGRGLADTNSKLLIACAYRPEEVASGRAGERHPLAKVLNELKRTFGDVWVDLSRVEESVDRRFINALLDSEPNRLGEAFRAALFNRTGGHPLFTIELLRAMQDRGELLKDDNNAWVEGPTLNWEILPERVEAVIEERIDRLDLELQDILTIASVEGEIFTAQVVAKARNMPERSLLNRLSQDLERENRLVREQDEIETNQRRMSRYRFSHNLFQDYLYNRLSHAERRLLHGDVGEALEMLYEGQQDEMAVPLAHHFHQAGDHENAFHYFTKAGERASRLYESRDAITYYTRAIQLAEKVLPDVVSLAKLYRGRGLASERIGEFEQARADHKLILQNARTAGELQVEWRAFLDLGRLWTSRDYNRARYYFVAALELARRMDEPAFLADSLNWMGNWYANGEDPQRAVAYHQEALTIFEALKDQRELANTLDLLALANLLSGDINTSLLYYNEAIMKFRELDDRPRLASSLIGRASTVSGLIWLASVQASQPADAISDLKEAIRIAKEIGSTPDQSWAHYSLGIIHTMHGQFEYAIKETQLALRIASDIEHREYEVATRFVLGILYSELFAPDLAREHLEEALSLTRELRSPTWTHILYGGLAGAYLILDDFDSAHACLEMVISPQTPMDTLGKRFCWVQQAELALKQDDPELALDITDRLISSAPGMIPERVITYLWMLKAEALAAIGHTENACSLLYSAIENIRETGEIYLLWRIHSSLGRFYRSMGRQEEAEKEFSKARELIQEMAYSVPDRELRNKFLRRAHERLRGSL